MEPHSRRFRLAFAAVVVVVLPGTWAWAQDRPDAVDAELSIGSDGRTVTSEFGTDSCGHPLRLDIDEGPTRVEVRTLVDRDWWLASCDEALFPRRLEGLLGEPLGDRELVAIR